MILATQPPLDAARETPDATGREPTTGRNLYLIGRPKLRDYLHYVRSHAVQPPDKGALTDEWEAAAQVVRALEREEAGIANDPPRITLGPEYEPLLIEFLKDPLIRHGFNTVPTEVVKVELDRLVVYQKHIDLSFVPRLEAALGPRPSDDLIFRTCLPFDHPKPPVGWSRVKRDQYIFVSPSNDLRFLGAMPMESHHIADYPTHGNLVGVVGIAVGFGSNFMNAIAAEGRIILNNGSHRAYTLRKLGVTHAPCIVQHAGSRAQLDVLAASDVEQDHDLYLSHPRPPMLKDYFDPRLHRVLEVHRRLRQIRVRFEVEENYVPAL